MTPSNKTRNKRFWEWAVDVEYRFHKWFGERNPPTQDPLRRFGLTGDDYALLGKLDKAFKDER